jgi:hypothetical protein
MARSVSDEAISSEDNDCFAPLAMTGGLQRFSFEREDLPFSVGWDQAAGRSRRECPGRKRGASSGLPSFSLHYKCKPL